MVDVGSVQVLTSSASGGVSPANDGPGGRSRAQVDDQQGRSANNRAVAFTAKFGNPEIDGGFRIVRGGEVQAIESADINALTEIRRSQAAAQALLSLQEVGDDGDAPAATDTETPAADGEATAPEITEADTGGAGLDTPAPTSGGANIETQAPQGGSGFDSAAPDAPAPTEGGADAPDIEVTLRDRTVTAGGTGGPPRGAVLDIVV